MNVTMLVNLKDALSTVRLNSIVQAVDAKMLLIEVLCHLEDSEILEIISRREDLVDMICNSEKVRLEKKEI